MELIQQNKYDLFIIDRMLPDSTGIEICQSLRNSQQTQATPILLVTAMAEPENIIEGLDAGADDYITKPFDIQVLQARVRAQLRRTTPPTNDSELIKVGNIMIDEQKVRVKNQHKEIKLTNTEFQILLTLAKSPGIVHKRRDIIDKVLGGDVHVTNRTIDTHIAGLRKKLGADSEIVETIRGVGYRLQDE